MRRRISNQLAKISKIKIVSSHVSVKTEINCHPMSDNGVWIMVYKQFWIMFPGETEQNDNLVYLAVLDGHEDLACVTDADGFTNTPQ